MENNNGFWASAAKDGAKIAVPMMVLWLLVFFISGSSLGITNMVLLLLVVFILYAVVIVMGQVRYQKIRRSLAPDEFTYGRAFGYGLAMMFFCSVVYGAFIAIMQGAILSDAVVRASLNLVEKAEPFYEQAGMYELYEEVYESVQSKPSILTIFLGAVYRITLLGGFFALFTAASTRTRLNRMFDGNEQ